MREFHIELSTHILTSNVDYGSYVKQYFEVVMTFIREWCISHLYHLSLDTLGVHLDPAIWKNKHARNFFVDVHSVMETINKSEVLKDIVDDFIKYKFGYFIK